MQPFSREAIVDRRQPAVRWSAVFAGAAVAAGTWLVLQLIFTGGALVAIDPHQVDSVRTFGIGSTAGTMLAALVAMFAGGYVATRLSGHYDKKVAGLHAILVWALTSIAGVLLLASAVGSMASRHETAMNAPPPGARAVIDQSLAPINQRLEQAGQTTITTDELIDASHRAAVSAGGFDREAFVARLDEQTALNHADAESVLRQLGANASDVMAAGDAIAQHRIEALAVAEDTGKGLLIAGVALLLCLGATLAGALIARRGLVGPRARRVPEVAPVHNTAPYPPVSPSGTYPAQSGYAPSTPYPPGVPYPPPHDDDER